MKQLPLFSASIGDAVRDGPRTLLIARIVGDDDAAPVIVEERGQFELMSRDSVQRLMDRRRK